MPFFAILGLFPCQTLAAKKIPTSISFSDSGTTFLVTESPDLPTPLLLDRLARTSPGKKSLALRHMFDSLGFFQCDFKRQSGAGVTINPGLRSRIDSLHIHADVPLPLDSLDRIKFPIPYDAGYIQSLAKKAIYFLGCRGYPYASLSMAVHVRIDSTVQHGTARRQIITVVFDVRDNGRYAFAKPLLLGKFKTSRKLLLHDVPITEGALFDLRKVEESRDRLQSRQYIASVDVSSPVVTLDAAPMQDTGSKTHAGPPLDKVIVPISCADKTGFGFEGAISFQAGGASLANSFYGVVNISLLNILHEGETGQLSYTGQQSLQRMELSLSKPYLLDFPVFASGDFGLEIRQDSSGYLHGDLQGLMELRAYWQAGVAVTAHEAQVSNDSAPGASSEYGGVDLILLRNATLYRAGEWSRGFTFRSGSGISRNYGAQYNRYHVDLSGSLQIPLTKRWAVAGRFAGKTIIAQPADTLRPAELYRVGGYNSLRGYADEEFSFKTVAIGQSEFLLYFSQEGSLYVFADGGIGYRPQVLFTIPSATKMFGYGVGIRIPSRIGNAAIEWGRNYQDTKSLGRIHISIMNQVSAGMGR